MPWWGWLIVGAILLGSELAVVDAAFYLVFLGLAAIAVGLFGMTGFAGPEWAQWLTFGVLSLFFMIAFRGRLYKKLKGDLPGYSDHADGKTIVIEGGLAPSAQSRIEWGGSSWTVLNVGSDSIAPGGAALVEKAVGVTLHVRAKQNSNQSKQSES